MQILALNCGSSSVKFAQLDPSAPDGSEQGIRGLAENLDGGDTALLRFSDAGSQGSRNLETANHEAAVRGILTLLRERGEGLRALSAVGHRVVHGGESFRTSARIGPSVIERIEELSALAPLHNPINLLGIGLLREALPDLPQVAVFDTAFHQSLPPRAFRYALPGRLYRELGVRRYGFHGSSHRYVAHEAIRMLALDVDRSALVTAHLGNGCSASAVLGGRSVDTSMGLSPLEGLVMGTRSGDVDPGLHEYLARRMRLGLSEITALLNEQSGLLGVSEQSHDMRQLWAASEAGDERAALAVELFCYRLAKQVAALVVPLARLDALVFTGGIGENAAGVRARVLALLGHLGLQVDAARNARHGRDSGGIISRDRRPVALVVPTDEEMLIARETAALIEASPAA
ncbi:MAG: acetate kinase [Deltaproteobacteria bacterium]|nr:acetate kinase [Deltaproteobacteria bacterium]